MADLGTLQNAIPDLNSLSEFRYENIFKLYKTDNNQYYYNALSTIQFPDTIDDSCFYTVHVNNRTPWTIVSYNVYGTIELWWLLVLINKIKNPILAEPTTIKVLKAEFVKSVISQISDSAK